MRVTISGGLLVGLRFFDRQVRAVSPSFLKRILWVAAVAAMLAGSLGSRPAYAVDCAREAKLNVDWVFRDHGATGTYRNLLATGDSSFEAVVGAQAHNRPVQALLRACEGWVEAYLQSIGAPAGGCFTLANRPVGPADCRCITVLPTGENDFTGNPLYRVKSSCNGLKVGVQFTGDIAHMSPDPRAMSSWAQAGPMCANQEKKVAVPQWTIININAISVEGARGSYVCRFDAGYAGPPPQQPPPPPQYDPSTDNPPPTISSPPPASPSQAPLPAVRREAPPVRAAPQPAQKTVVNRPPVPTGTSQPYQSTITGNIPAAGGPSPTANGVRINVAPSQSDRTDDLSQVRRDILRSQQPGF